MDHCELLDRCIKEERQLQFETFQQTDARYLGNLIYETSRQYSKPVAIEIRLNHLCIYRYFPNGTNRNNELWLRAKANTVDMLGISTLHFFAETEISKGSLADRRMDEKRYTRFGGGFPLILKNSGMVGSICVSGLDHTLDHQVIVDALGQYCKIVT